ncbi:APC family permease [Lentiprolixibacter aurantiacus]|uniref:Amino acid permease n=1 Tax=Lentiprolixibacter aurantiacus TaxID=2993939 RepID=A0AAE3MJM1_9FLAO|nr:amino acid permease [Lentiprolixibacter aurantiacus]MCX2718433.1 amino acid permease [Lentiprolixibacter aurantiacus]
MTKAKTRIGWSVGAALVVANMVGTGVFTSLGFQLMDIQNTWSVLGLWVLGGILALIGAFCYAEIGSAIQKSGGEYVFLSRLYHPVLGYMAGWISLTVGFAAPIALAAMALGAYLGNVLDVPPQTLAIGVIIIIALVHSFNLSVSSQFQSFATWFKVILILFLIGAGFWVSSSASALDFSASWTGEILKPSFAIAFVYVTYSYTGWNAASYIIEEIDKPRINLPKALVRGTLIVTLLYVLLHVVFLKHGDLDSLKGQLDVGHVYATNVFGNEGAVIINVLIAFFLISSISAMTWVGPRVSQAMGRDFKLWKFLNRQNKNQIPVLAVWFQAGISIVYVVTGTFESVLLYCGFILQLSALLTVFGVFILRRKGLKENQFKSPLYPWLPLIFVLISLWILIYLLIDQPKESLVGLLILGIGVLTYYVSPKSNSS